MDSSSDINSELESFREQWRAEFRARNAIPAGQQQANSAGPSRSRRPVPSGQPDLSKRPAAPDIDEDYVRARPFEEPDQKHVAPQSPAQNSFEGKEPLSALDHYEKAVEKEAQGSLGDSLRLYRKAFRVGIPL